MTDGNGTPIRQRRRPPMCYPAITKFNRWPRKGNMQSSTPMVQSSEA